MNQYLIAASYIVGLLTGYALILMADRIAAARACRNAEAAEGPSEDFKDPSHFRNLILANLNAFAWMITFAKHGVSVRTAFILAAMS
ncbi:MAG: hypothetical protein ACYC5K_13165, partial [Saccharofermentanales bacterium]